MSEAPYPADTRAKGWRFELDYEQIEQSTTWSRAKPEVRPWLLMLWMMAWKQVPCGSLPDDREAIAGLIGIPDKLWERHGATLLRGWWLASDGRLYHETLVARVIEMMSKRRSDSDRQAAKRAREAADKRMTHAGVTPESRVTPPGVTRESSTDNRPPITERDSEPIGSAPGGANVIALDAAAAEAMRKEAVFALGVPILEAAGNSEKSARLFLGHLRKNNSDRAVVAALDRCARERALDPRGFLMGCLNSDAKPINRQEALEADGDRVVAEWLSKGKA